MSTLRSQLSNGVAAATPGLPPAVTTESAEVLPVDLSKLWTLSYIRNNAIKTIILYFPDNPTLDIAVARAKKYCAEKRFNFSWMEQSIVVLNSKEDETQ